MLQVKNISLFNRVLIVLLSASVLVFCVSFVAVASEGNLDNSGNSLATQVDSSSYGRILPDALAEPLDEAELRDVTTGTRNPNNATTDLQTQSVDLIDDPNDSLNNAASDSSSISTFDTGVTTEIEYKLHALVQPFHSIGQFKIIDSFFNKQNDPNYVFPSTVDDRDKYLKVDLGDKIQLGFSSENVGSGVVFPVDPYNWSFYYTPVDLDAQKSSLPRFDCGEAFFQSAGGVQNYGEWSKYNPHSEITAYDVMNRKLAVVACYDQFISDPNTHYVISYDYANAVSTKIEFTPLFLASTVDMCVVPNNNNGYSCGDLVNGYYEEDRDIQRQIKSSENAYFGTYYSDTKNAIIPRHLTFNNYYASGPNAGQLDDVYFTWFEPNTQTGLSSFYLCDISQYGGDCDSNSPSHNGSMEGSCGWHNFPSNSYSADCMLYVRNNLAAGWHYGDLAVHYEYLHNTSSGEVIKVTNQFSFGQFSVYISDTPSSGGTVTPPPPTPPTGGPSTGGSVPPPTGGGSSGSTGGGTWHPTNPTTSMQTTADTSTIDLSNSDSDKNNVSAAADNSNNSSGGSSKASSNPFLDFLHMVNWPLIGLFLSLLLIILCLVLIFARMGYRISKEKDEQVSNAV